MKRIYLSPPHMSGKEQDYIQEAFDSNWIAPLGPNVDNFEKDLADYTGSGQALTLSSGTAAIHLALILLGVKHGDNVICQSMTFSATANPIYYTGARPVFVDSEAETWNMCPSALEEAIKQTNPKAVIAVHLYGMPAKMDAILDIAAKYDLPVIEDAAEALGSHIRGRKCGSFGLLGTLSFNGNKIITTSGGGALLSNNQELINRARFLATQARDPAPHYQHSEIGYNYRMSNILAGIGRAQMEVLDSRIAVRRKIFDFYQDLLAGVDGVSFHPEPEGYFSNRWLTAILINPQKTGGIGHEQVRKVLEDHNIESRPLWKPMHRQPVFSTCPFFNTGVSDQLFEQGLCLPSGTGMTDADIERIAGALLKAFGH